MEITIFNNALAYYTWVIAMSMMGTALFALRKLTISNKGLLSKASKYIFNGVALFLIASVLVSIQHPEFNVVTLIEVLALFLSGLSIAYASYYISQITSILNIKKKKYTPPMYAKIILLIGIFTALIGTLRFGLNNSFLNSVFEGMSLITGISFFLIGFSLTNLTGYYPLKLSKQIIYKIAYIPLAFGIIALVGHLINMPILYAPLFGGGTSIPTAISIIFLSSVILLIPWYTNTRFKIFSVTILISSFAFGLLALAGYIFSLPTLYGEASFARMSISTAITLLLLSGSVLKLFYHEL